MGYKKCVKNLLLGLLVLSIAFECRTTVIDEELQKAFSSLDHQWGYVDVRPKAHMFWWLFQTTAQDKDKPLIIWLQGGPGISGTGYGNFEEIGPYDSNLNLRNNTWIKNYNVLFIDGPVGTGFSYFENNTYCSDFQCITTDLMTCIKEFLRQFPKYSKIPTYVLGESYGGLYTVELAKYWHQEQSKKNISSNFQGIGLFSAPLSIPRYLIARSNNVFNSGLTDFSSYTKLSNSVDELLKAVEKNDWENATEKFINHSILFKKITSGINLYKIDEKVGLNYEGFVAYSQKLKDTMKRLKIYLGLKSDWNSDDSYMVHDVLYSLIVTGSYYHEVLTQLEQLLTNTDVKVFILNGQFDGVVTPAGTMKNIEELKWPLSQCWSEAPIESLVINGIVEGFSKGCGNLKYYLVYRSGHSIAADNPVAVEHILRNLTISLQ